jgi:hypothetical protein
MKATYIRTEYVTMCAKEATDELVEMIAEELSESIQRDEMMKELGIDLSSLFGSTLD